MPKRWIAPVEGGRIRLRLLEETDLPMTLNWRNQDHIRKWFFTSEPLTAGQHRAWFDKYRESDCDFVFIIEELPFHLPVGQVALYDIDWDARRAEFGRLMIGELDAVGKGLAFEATNLLVRTALQDLGLRETYLEVFANNDRAVAIYTACGFQVIGQRENVLTMAKTNKRD